MRSTEKFWFWRELVFTNLSRGVKLAFVLLSVDTILLILDVGRLLLGQTASVRGYSSLFVAHVALAGLLTAFLVVYYIMRPRSVEEIKGRHAALMLAYSALMMTFATVVSIIDQEISGQITIYVVGCMSLAVAVYLPPRASVPIYITNHAGFIVAMVILQENAAVLVSHLVNGTIVMMLAVVVMKLMFDAQRRVYQGLSLIETQQARLERMAIEDSLTGLFNRRYLDARLQEEFERSRRYRRPFSVAMADIDRFKEINDRNTHQVGDEVLRRLSGLLRAEIRAVDVIARYGGDEFVIVFPETGESTAIAVCEKIRQSVEHENWDVVAEGLCVTMSVGVSGSGAAESAEGVIHAADKRLYAAKNAGRNRVVGSP